MVCAEASTACTEGYAASAEACKATALCFIWQQFFHEVALCFVIACHAPMRFFIAPCSTTCLNNLTQVGKNLGPDWLVTCTAFMCLYLTIQHCRFKLSHSGRNNQFIFLKYLDHLPYHMLLASACHCNTASWFFFKTLKFDIFCLFTAAKIISKILRYF